MSKEQTQGKWAQIMKKFGIKLTQSEPYSPWQVRAEGCIREVKKSTRQIMTNTRAPKCLWDYGAVYVCEKRCLTAHPHFALHGRTPYEMVTGRTPDISEYVDFQWNDLLCVLVAG
jgi:CMP-N-acetylneuraminic acid synthetase